ncbi:hypothetical protein [Bacteroides sp. UBA939]|uniref:hypothetical protein n=1 Tax=Bacteroides sp. UBA939 TaxID=1946092 RepID=UPI0025B9DA5E|nr:hypothetical protein [Bacteroides sp. UBA939]
MKRRFLPRRTLSASTMMETITASVVFMIIFVLAMDTLTRLVVNGNEDSDSLLIETDMNKCRRRICQSTLVPGVETYEYDWGQMVVEITAYKDKEDIYQIEMIATTDKHREIRFRFLEANE